MDDLSFSKKANISAISRFDHQVKDIILSASQVALYVFDAKKAKWTKRKTEGACFIYKRKTSPRYGLFVLNRLDTTNFIELLNSTMEIQLQEPFILYRNISKTIYGIWFYEKSECKAMADVFQRILDELKEKERLVQEEDECELATPTLTKDQAGSNEMSVDLLEETSNNQPDSVRQFFAKASKEVTRSQPLAIVQQPCGSKLCSAFKSVAHIEKAQKSDPDNISVFDLSVRGYHYSNIVSPVGSSSTTDENGVDSQMKTMSLGPSVQEVERYSQSLLLKDEIVSPSEFPELIPPGMLLTPDIKADVEKLEANPSKLLNKNQMLDALQYLMNNDPHFVDTLYDAYLKTLKKN
ncbi:hypothetical protein V9T40_005911 [Parthenolecanium corni]|uniref:mRNA-decapping enzyme C-terminal domain-containing protein n=1 Tax=Parthenolecanium corni TaxID=536013 RepID=A0AAN9TTE6_9HEMI